MAEEAAQGTPLKESMNQDFAQAIKDVEARSVQPPAEQAAAPVSVKESEGAEEEAKPEGDQSAEKPTKEQPTEEKLAAMRADDYTRKTQALAREREQFQEKVAFADAWEATAVAYNRASQEVQQEVKGLLEGRLQPRSKSAAPQGAPNERITKLLDSFEDTDKSAVKDIFDTLIVEAEERANQKVAELQAKLDAISQQTNQETEIRAAREAQEGFAAFAEACPEWEQMTERERLWFQRDITENTDLDPIAHFKSEFLPRLSARTTKPTEPKPVPKPVQRASQAVLQPSTNQAAPRKEKPGSLKDTFEMVLREKGLS